MEPLISVIVPIYNVERYLPRCLDSILAQTYRNLEIILVDDGSKDGSGGLCDAYAAQDPRIRVIHKENGGVAAARNTALKAYSGAFLMFVDADDYLSPDAVCVLYERLIADGSDMAIGRHTDVFADGSSDGTFYKWMVDSIYNREDLLSKMAGEKRFSVAPWGKLYRREIMQNIVYPPLVCGEDLWVFTQIMDQCNRLSVVDHQVYFYYQRADSLVHVRTERSKADELEATLHMAAYFMRREKTEGARYWFGLGVLRGARLDKGSQALAVIEKYFDGEERKALRKHQGLLIHLLWAALHFQPLLELVKLAKAVRDRFRKKAI